MTWKPTAVAWQWRDIDSDSDVKVTAAAWQWRDIDRDGSSDSVSYSDMKPLLVDRPCLVSFTGWLLRLQFNMTPNEGDNYLLEYKHGAYSEMI